MRRAMITKNKLKFLDGFLPIPDRFDPSFDAWERCNNLVHSWFINFVSPTIGESIVFMETEVEAWQDLQDCFSQGDLVMIFELQHEISGLKQGNLSVTEYFTALM